MVERDYTKGSVVRKMTSTLCFVAFGASIFSNPLDMYNPYRIGFGILVCLFFGWLFKKFLRGFLSMFNGAVKKEKGREAISYAVDTGMLYLVPFAAVAVVAAYVLRWSLTGAFISTGIMAVGTASAIEIGKLMDKKSVKNTLITSGVSYLFSFTLTLTIPILIKAPGLFEGLIKLIPSFFNRGGGGL